MKRSGPPSRRTPLRRTGGPRRRRPMSLGPSERRRRRDAGYPAARQAAHNRAEGACEARVPDICDSHAPLDRGHAHHLAGRGGPDPHRIDNLLWCCPSCHHWIHLHPAESYDRGWMRRRNTRTDDRDTP